MSTTEIITVPDIPADSIAALARMFMEDAEYDARSRTAADDITPSTAGASTETGSVDTARTDRQIADAPRLGSTAINEVVDTEAATPPRSRRQRPTATRGRSDGAVNPQHRKPRRPATEERETTPAAPSDEAIVISAHVDSDAALPRITAPQAALAEKREPDSADVGDRGAVTIELNRADLLRGTTESASTSHDDKDAAETAAIQTTTIADTRPSLPQVKPLDYDDQRHQLARLNHIRKLLATEGLSGASVRNEADLRGALALGFAYYSDPSKIPNVLVVCDPGVNQSLIDEARQDILVRRGHAFRMLQRADIGTSALEELKELDPAEHDAAHDVITRIAPYLRDSEQVLGGDNAQDVLERIALIIHAQGLSPLTIVTAEWAVAQYYSLHHMNAQPQTETEGRTPVRLFDEPAVAQDEAHIKLFDAPEPVERVTAAAAWDKLDQVRREIIIAGSQSRVRGIITQLGTWRKDLATQEDVQSDEIPQRIIERASAWLSTSPDELDEIQENSKNRDNRTWQALHRALQNRLNAQCRQDMQRGIQSWLTAEAKLGIEPYDAVSDQVFSRLGVDLNDLIALSLKINEGQLASGYSVSLQLDEYTDGLVDMLNKRQAAEVAQPRYPGVDWQRIGADTRDGAQRAVARVRGWFSQLSEHGARIFDSGAAAQEAQAEAYAASQPRAPRVPAQQYAQPRPDASDPARRAPLVQQHPDQGSQPSGALPTIASSLSRPSNNGPRELTPEEYATFTAQQFTDAGHDLAHLDPEVQERLAVAARQNPESANDAFLRDGRPEQRSEPLPKKATMPNYL